MVKRCPRALRPLLVPLAAIAFAAQASAQLEPFQARFDATLSKHGVIGGGFAVVHQAGLPVQHFFAARAVKRTSLSIRNFVQLGFDYQRP